MYFGILPHSIFQYDVLKVIGGTTGNAQGKAALLVICQSIFEDALIGTVTWTGKTNNSGKTPASSIQKKVPLKSYKNIVGLITKLCLAADKNYTTQRCQSDIIYTVLKYAYKKGKNDDESSSSISSPQSVESSSFISSPQSVESDRNSSPIQDLPKDLPMQEMQKDHPMHSVPMPHQPSLMPHQQPMTQPSPMIQTTSMTQPLPMNHTNMVPLTMAPAPYRGPAVPPQQYQQYYTNQPYYFPPQ